jgi:hypothetical protein
VVESCASRRGPRRGGPMHAASPRRFCRGCAAIEGQTNCRIKPRCCLPVPRGDPDRTATKKHLGVLLVQSKAGPVLALYRSLNKRRSHYKNWPRSTMKTLSSKNYRRCREAHRSVLLRQLFLESTNID